MSGACGWCVMKDCLLLSLLPLPLPTNRGGGWTCCPCLSEILSNKTCLTLISSAAASCRPPSLPYGLPMDPSLPCRRLWTLHRPLWTPFDTPACRTPRPPLRRPARHLWTLCRPTQRVPPPPPPVATALCFIFLLLIIIFTSKFSTK